MHRRTTVFLGSFALLGLAGTARAQTESRPRTDPVGVPARKPVTPATRPRIAIIPSSPPAQPIVVNTTGMTTNIDFVAPAPSSSGQVPIAPVVQGAPVVQLYYLPTVVLADGRILANFGTGHGYEQVLRQCPSFTGTIPPNVALAACWQVDAYGRYSVLQQR
jgi:hypothetical protein